MAKQLKGNSKTYGDGNTKNGTMAGMHKDVGPNADILDVRGGGNEKKSPSHGTQSMDPDCPK